MSSTRRSSASGRSFAISTASRRFIRRSSSRLEPGPDAYTVGAVRYLTLADGYVREKLLKLDEPNHALEYAIVESTMPVRDYVAGVQLVPVTDSGKTFAQWWANFTTQGVELQPVAESISEHVFAAGFRALADKLRAR